ncbi:CDP-diacylglycerol diphosphatase [Rhizobium sp. WL3]|uniref:CDP-diacylglycerol diphosphatase n=1 Tax=Rhizobium sp. WL3 TaxID=2603277 RepID=UPI00165088FF|nr:CDP-diacylglycerol diphosphatase [Rhizobium sp. WL3]
MYTTIAVALAGTTTQAADFRTALRAVVATCELSFNVAAVPFPCLKVQHSQDPLQSFAILREPTGARRTILSPLADVPGIEDVRLLAPNAPNYFALAWNERSLVIPEQPDQWKNVVLAINASVNRTQDHLHIHMGCLDPGVAEKLSSAPVSTEEFRRLNVKLNGRIYWARFLPGTDLTSINPIQLAERDVFLAKRFMAGITIAVVGAERERVRGFIILAFTMPPQPKQPTAAGDLVSQECTVETVGADDVRKSG